MDEKNIQQAARDRRDFRGNAAGSLSNRFPLITIILLFVVLLAVGVPTASSAAPPFYPASLDMFERSLEASVIEEGLAYVAVANHNYLAVVDPVSGVVSDTVDLAPSGCRFPWRVAIPPDGQSVWVSCRHSGTVIVLDRSNHEILQAINEQQSPTGITFTQDSAYALIGTSSYGDVVVVDTSTFALATTMETDEYPSSVVMHPYLPVAYVVHRLYEGVVTVIDTTSWTVTQSIKAGSSPKHAAISRDGLQLYLANQGNNTVSVINTVSLQLETEINIDAMPRDLVVSPDDLTLYVTRSWGDGIAVIDVVTNTIQQTISIDSGGDFSRPWGIDQTCDGSTLITTNSGGYGEENRQVALTDTGTMTSVLLPMPDQDSDSYPDAGARGLAVCPQYVPEDIFLVPAAQSQRATRGEDAIYTVALYNFSGMEDSYTIALDEHEWGTVLSSESIGPLNHGESAEVTLTMTVPQDADWYATDSVNLTATSVVSPEIYEATAALETEAYAPPAMTVSPLSLSSTQDAGEVVHKTLDIANGVGVELEFELGTTSGPGTSFTAASTELYGYMVGGFVRIIGLSDDTNIQLIDLSNGSIIDQTNALSRYETWDVYPGSGTYFKLVADKPVVAFISSGSYWGYTSFIPSIDMGPMGKEFIFYHSQGDSFLYVFAIEDANVELRDADGYTVDSRSLSAGDYWKMNPDSGAYHAVASGRIALELVAENSYSTVPSTEGQAVGQQFYFATDGWGTGAVAAFAYEDADIDLYDLNDDALLYSTSLSADEYWWQVGLEDRQLRLESSGDVEVWAGNTEGGQNIEDLGDDISFAGGMLGRVYHLHSLREGFVIFAPFDNTEIAVDQINYSLGKDDYLHFPDCCAAHKIIANQPILVQTLGRDGSWNDFGTYLGGVVEHSGEPVPWLTADPASGAIATESTTPIDVTFDAAGIQPGTHTADVIVVSNDPALPFVEVPVEMLVEPTADMGQVFGSVSDAWTDEQLAATITLDGVYTTVPTTAYEIWAAEGTYTLIASAAGYAGQEFTIDITADGSVKQDIALEPNMARMELDPETLKATAVEGSTTAATLTINNTGPDSLEVSFHELPALEKLMSTPLTAVENRKILYDRAHNEPPPSEVSNIVDDLTAAGAIVDENFIYSIDTSVLAGYDVLWINCCGYTNWTFDELTAIKSWLDDGGAILIHGEESPAARGVAGLYGIEYHSSCSYGTTTDIEEHPITIGAGQIYVNTCSYLTFGSSSVLAVKDNNGQPHVVTHEEKRGKMVVVAGSDFSNWVVDEDDNRLLAHNSFVWLAEPGYEDISWLQSELAEAEIPGHTSQEVTIHVDASNMVKGMYDAILAIEHNDPNRLTPAKLPVQLTVGSSPPIAAFSASPTSGPPSLAVNFTNLSTGDYNECLWEFGDGSTSAACDDPSHTYGNPGSFKVSLKVKGPGGENKMTKTDYITIYSPPTAAFGASPTSGSPSLAVKFTNLSTGDFNKCLWEFGDGGTSADCNDPSHTYDKPGFFTVSLKINGPGGESKIVRTDYITAYEPPTAAFNASPRSGVPELMVEFTNLSTGDFNECLWDFGDGITSAICNDPSHTYDQPGYFSVNLKVKGLGGEDKVTKTDYITVHGPQMANFSASPRNGVSELTVEFTNLSTGDFDECLWEFGDDSTSAICNDSSHMYGEPGILTVSLKVKGPGGESKIVKTDYINVYEPPTAAFSASPTSGVVPLTVDFTNLSTGDFDECLWDFGDGSKETACSNLVHNYESDGHYTVKLTVQGSGGEDTMTVEQCVKVASYRIFLPKVLKSQ